MIATVTIQGIYRYNPHLFDGLVCPAGVNEQETIRNILRVCADLPALYADPAFLQDCISNWAFTRFDNWERVYGALSAEYEILDNYNGIEEEWEDVENTGTRNDEGKDYVQGFNIDTGMTESGKSTAESVMGGTESRHVKRKRHGNLGVTTSQQMIESELELRQKYNIYEYIAADFKSEFCLGIY